MINSNITNNHLKDVVEKLRNYLDKEEDAPLELIAEFICELKVSNLLIPAIDEEDSFAFEHLASQEDESIFIPLFTDIEEYNKHSQDNSEYEPVDFEFEVYSDLVLENDLEGIILNVDGNFLPIEKDFIKEMYFETDADSDEDTEEYTAGELKDLFENVTNESLVEFINGPDSDDIEKLYVELSNSTLLNLVVDDGSMDEFAEDGIIKSEDVDGFRLCSIENEEVRLGAIFTDKDAALKAINAESGLSYYGQVTVLSELLEFILRTDMDGVIINPNTDDYLIAREDILPQASGIEIVIDNPRIRNSLEYAFLL